MDGRYVVPAIDSEQVKVWSELGNFWTACCIQPSSVSRDNEDITKVRVWPHEHPPLPNTKEIVSLSTGDLGCEEVNRHTARQIRRTCMIKNMVQPFELIHLKQRARCQQLLLFTVPWKLLTRKSQWYVEPYLVNDFKKRKKWKSSQRCLQPKC